MEHYKDELDMMGLLAMLGPMDRTLASEKTDRALEIIAQHLPGSVIEGFTCGSDAWTWKIPMRWEVESATICAGKEVLVDFAWHPMHLLNYSQPFSGEVTHEELISHINTSPDKPDAIPFSFSYYVPKWGFSVPHNWLPRFKSSRYYVDIKTRFNPGNMNVLSCNIPGDSDKTIVICSNICHPTQVNDSLTGVAVSRDIIESCGLRV